MAISGCGLFCPAYGLATAEMFFLLLYTGKELLVWQEIWSRPPYWLPATAAER